MSVKSVCSKLLGGLDKKEFAEELHIPYSSLMRYLNEEKELPPTKLLKAISEYSGLPESSLIAKMLYDDLEMEYPLANLFYLSDRHLEGYGIGMQKYNNIDYGYYYKKRNTRDKHYVVTFDQLKEVHWKSQMNRKEANFPFQNDKRFIDQKAYMSALLLWLFKEMDVNNLKDVTLIFNQDDIFEEREYADAIDFGYCPKGLKINYLLMDDYPDRKFLLQI